MLSRQLHYEKNNFTINNILPSSSSFWSYPPKTVVGRIDEFNGNLRIQQITDLNFP